MDKHLIFQNSSDEELMKIVTEDFRKYSTYEIDAVITELKKRDYELDKEVSDDINQYLQAAKLSDDELLKIVQNRWNYSMVLVEEVEKVLEDRGLKVDNRDMTSKVASNETTYPDETLHGNKNYEIYRSPVGSIEAVKKGWCWPVFFFTWIWAFVKHMYVLGSIIPIIGIILNLLFLSRPLIALILDLSVICWFGYSGNEFRRDNLKARGFECVGTVPAKTPEGAIAIFVREGKKARIKQKNRKKANN